MASKERFPCTANFPQLWQLQIGARSHRTELSISGTHTEPSSRRVRVETNASRVDRSPSHLLHRAGQCAAEIFQAEVSDLTSRS